MKKLLILFLLICIPSICIGLTDGNSNSLTNTDSKSDWLMVIQKQQTLIQNWLLPKKVYQTWK